jgi:hypothetical protein
MQHKHTYNATQTSTHSFVHSYIHTYIHTYIHISLSQIDIGVNWERVLLLNALSIHIDWTCQDYKLELPKFGVC